ncbi:MAG: DHA2 family efflux MFS transporter permease subunit [Betaproteobacteria bacterium]
MTEVASAPASPGPPSRSLGLIGLCIGVFMFTLDASIVNVAMPTLVKAFDTTFAVVQWVVLSYLLVATALVMAAAHLGDRFGRRRSYLFGLAVFTIGSLLCGLSTSIATLIACRVLQGLGAVFVSALGAAIVGEMFKPNERGRALGMIGSAVLLGVAIGPSIGGFIIELAGWRWMFLVNIPVGIGAFFAVRRFVPESSVQPSDHPFDWLGTVLAAVLLSAFALGMTWGQRDGFTSTLVLALLAFAVVALILFIVVESRAAGPILDLRLLRNKAFASGLLISGIVFLVLGGTGFLLPFFLEVVSQYSIGKVGMLMAISPVLGGVTAPFGGMLSDRLGSRWVAFAGLALIAVGCFSFGSIDDHVSVLGFALRVAPFGIGMGLFNAANNSSVLNAVPRERLSIASALLSLMRTLGQTTGVPVIASIFALSALGHTGSAQHQALLTLSSDSLVRGIHVAFVSAGLIVMVGLVGGVWEYLRRAPAATSTS